MPGSSCRAETGETPSTHGDMPLEPGRALRFDLSPDARPSDTNRSGAEALPLQIPPTRLFYRKAPVLPSKMFDPLVERLDRPHLFPCNSGPQTVGAVYESVNKSMECVNQANNPLLT